MRYIVAFLFSVILLGCSANRSIGETESINLQTSSFEDVNYSTISDYNKIEVTKDSISSVVRRDNR